MMKFLLCACIAVLAGVSATNSSAADISGKWTAEMQTPGGGDSMQIQFLFSQDGTTLTGSVQGPQGDEMAISDGKVDGDNISFKVSFNGMTIMHEGRINAEGDEIKLNTKSDSADFPAMEMTLKRMKAAPVPASIALPGPLSHL